jgi:programmed cell death 6-interacting protein
MLAQAQTCFYEKSVKEQKAGTMKASIVCKLASQIVLHYNSALSYARHANVSTVVDISWIHHMEFQKESFRALAEYWQGIASQNEASVTGIGYGAQICRLRRAERILATTLQNGKTNKVPSPVIASTENVLAVINRARVNAEKDNDGIYHELVPDEHTLSDISPIQMVRCSDMPEYYNTEKPFFADLLPKEVKVLVAKHKEAVEMLLRDTTAAASKATNDGRAALSELGLPGSLELYKSGGQLPENLWVKIQRVQTLGGLSELRQKLSGIQMAAERARQTMDSIEVALQREESNDMSFRQRNPQVTLQDASRLHEDIRENVLLLRERHKIAGTSDDAIRVELQSSEILEYMEILFKSREEISNMLPKANGGDAMIGYIDTSRLEDKLIKIANLFETRDRAIQTLQNAAKTDVTEILAQKLSSSTPPYSSDLLDELVHIQVSSQLGSYVDAVNATLSNQESLLSEVCI